jgi:hypothetical protein
MTRHIPCLMCKVERLLGLESEETSILRGALHEDVIKNSDIVKLQKFLQSPWFQRRWIIHEVARGHDSILHCGPFRKPWHWFVDALRRLRMASKARIEGSLHLIQHLWILCTMLAVLLFGFQRATHPHVGFS